MLGNKEKKQNWSSTPYKNLTLKASLLAISQLLSLPAEKCFITKDILLILGQLVRDFQKKKQAIYNHSHNIFSTNCHMKSKRGQRRKNYLFLFAKNTWLNYVMIQ